MNAKYYSELFSQLDVYQLSYAYNGEFTEKLTEQILSLLENSMNVESESSKTKKRVYFIMVESLQNITRHQSNTGNDNLLDGFFSIHKAKNGYLITSGNLVKVENIEPLKEKLEKLNALNPEELKTYYQELLAIGGFSEKGGAGLGLIEMLRKSGNKLVYDFIDLSKQLSYFYFQAIVSTPTDGAEEEEKPNNLNLAKNMHIAVINHNLSTIFHGQFGHENFKGLLAMAENNFAAFENIKTRKTTISVMIELLQNICFHADGKKDYNGEGPGMFIVSRNVDNIKLTTVNYMENPKTDYIINHAKMINEADVEESRKMFLEILMRDDVNRSKGAGLGLIDIRIKSNNKVDVQIVPHNNELSFIVVSATINL